MKQIEYLTDWFILFCGGIKNYSVFIMWSKCIIFFVRFEFRKCRFRLFTTSLFQALLASLWQSRAKFQEKYISLYLCSVFWLSKICNLLTWVHRPHHRQLQHPSNWLIQGIRLKCQYYCDNCYKQIINESSSLCSLSSLFLVNELSISIFTDAGAGFHFSGSGP